jgi:hypothetical protein
MPKYQIHKMGIALLILIAAAGLLTFTVNAQTETPIQVFCASTNGRIQVVFTNWLANEAVTAWVDAVEIGQYATDANGNGSYSFPPGAAEILVKRSNGDTLAAGTADCSQPLPGEISTVSQYNVTLPISGTVSLSATGQDAAGNEIPIAVIWITPSGSITPQGEFTASEEGEFFISANLIGDRGAHAYLIDILVTPPLASLDVTPTEVFLFPGQSVNLEVVATDVNGNLVEVTPSWDTAGAGDIVPLNLFFAGETTGDYVITGSIPGTDLQVEVFVRISPELDRTQITPSVTELTVGETQQFDLLGFDPDGNEISLPIPPTWTAELGVIDASGNYAATTAGDETITALVDLNAIQGNPGGRRGLAMEIEPLIYAWSFKVLPPVDETNDQEPETEEKLTIETEPETGAPEFEPEVIEDVGNLKDDEHILKPDEFKWVTWLKLPRWVQYICLTLIAVASIVILMKFLIWKNKQEPDE